MDRLRRNNVISGNHHDQRDAGGVEAAFSSAKAALKTRNTSAAPAMKDGQDAVMQRWLMSAQKLRRCPSAITSRPPSLTTRALAARSCLPVIILLDAFRFAA